MLFNAAALLPVVIAFAGVQAAAEAIPCKLVNVGSNATAFTFDANGNGNDTDVLLSMDTMANEDWSMWDVPHSESRILVNSGTGQWLTVYRADNHLITSNNGPTQFAVTDTTDGQFTIGLPDQTDKAFEAVFDGTAGKYGKIILISVDEGSPYQRWTCN
ncbi:hypothetical protein FB45DRAFT_122933 [Roridomyces roridus]|uniref:Uncharacterized protein n=1 Tax=Roridomyces roridus TaxID=1738132 RepID=A0AAD7BIK0_9AGAR|nr:hypothetical protein FB45DRAFT_122933 [Roridomyces roridus]